MRIQFIVIVFMPLPFSSPFLLILFFLIGLPVAPPRKKAISNHEHPVASQEGMAPLRYLF